MPQNKLKQKVEGLTRIVKGLLNEVRANTDLAQGTLTAFQLHIGKDEWEKIVNELKEVEERRAAAQAGINGKNLDLDVE
jgi:hypothetical protein|tara:strand:- start:337 stop:573 length:237 start_codon:yes stop_codon:yes gene_type:complete